MFFEREFHLREKQEEERGKKNALEFLKTNPSKEKIKIYYNCAKEDVDFTGDPYAKAVVNVLILKV